MSSRMEKYSNNSNYEELSRTKRNEHIYNSTDIGELSRIKTSNNVSVISDGGKTVDLEKIKNYINSINTNTEEERKKISLDLPKEELVIVRKEEKDYDINAVLEKARENQERDYEENRHRKINNTQIEILKSIKIKESKKNDDLTPSAEELNTEEKTIVDLIQNIQNNSKNNKKKDLFDDLMADDDETAVIGIKEGDNIKEALLNMTQDLENIMIPESDFTQEINMEIEKMKSKEKEEEDIEEINQDNSFYTSSVSFDKSDFEIFDDLEETAKKSSIFTKIAILLVLILLLGTIFIIVNYVFDLNLI